MVEFQWDSLVPSPYSPALTSLELMFMGLSGSNCGLFRDPGCIVSPVGKGEKKTEKGKEGKKIQKERKE